MARAQQSEVSVSSLVRVLRRNPTVPGPGIVTVPQTTERNRRDSAG